MANRKASRDGLANAYRAKNNDVAVRRYCEALAESVLMTANLDACRGLAVCFFVNVAARVGARSSAAAFHRTFGE